MRNGPTALGSTYVQLRFPVTQLVHLLAGLEGPSPVLRERRGGERCDSGPRDIGHFGTVKGPSRTYSVLRGEFEEIGISADVSSVRLCVADLSSADIYRKPAGVCVFWYQGGPRPASVRPLSQ